jgi:hypothetical protein
MFLPRVQLIHFSIVMCGIGPRRPFAAMQHDVGNGGQTGRSADAACTAAPDPNPAFGGGHALTQYQSLGRKHRPARPKPSGFMALFPGFVRIVCHLTLDPHPQKSGFSARGALVSLWS